MGRLRERADQNRRRAGIAARTQIERFDVTPAEWLARAGASHAVRRDAEAALLRVARTMLFSHDREILVARAPGRLDVIGGVADYSGSMVLEWPLADATFVAIQRQPDPALLLVSGERTAHASLPELLSFDYADARTYFSVHPAKQWMAYIAGVFIVLARECSARFPEGARILIMSSVPEGKGVSSSAALEVATMSAVCAAYGVTLEGRQLALLCQKVENVIAGAPCGVMDQATATLGECDRLLSLLCQPAEVQGCYALPQGFAFWGIDSGIRHAVTDSDYRVVRAATFMGRRILQTVTERQIEFLTDVTPAEFEGLAPELPGRMSGREFFTRFGETGDPMTTVDPERMYPVRSATAHPVYEHARARKFAELLSRCDDDPQGTATREEQAGRLGTLMYESHDSYSACGLASAGTDALVNMLRRAGSRAGVYGAKITGGGCGGTVAILGRTDVVPLLHTVAVEYAHESGVESRVFAGSSAGSAAYGVCSVRT
jgi:galactokinase